jgi:hypothetical protein
MGDMTVLWWFVATLLVVLSSILLAAGLQGKEGTLRIGKATGPEVPGVDEAPNAQPRAVHASNIAVGVIGILVGIAAVLLFGV